MKNIIEILLEPNNPEVKSKIYISFDDDMIRTQFHDCDKSITYRFKTTNSIKKIERIRVALDLIENELKLRNLK